MSKVTRKNIDFKPREIIKISPEYIHTAYAAPEQASKETIDLANKLNRHIKTINDYKARLDAVNFLLENAEKLAKNLSFEADDPEIEAILRRRTDGNVMDFNVFKSAINDTIEEWKRLALISITGTSDRDVVKEALNGEL